MLKERTLKEVLESAESISWDEDLFLAGEPSDWQADSPALTIPSDAVDEDDAHPDAELRGMRYILGMSAVQDIKSNALQNNPSADIGQLMKALVYYLENDAFETS